MSGIAPRTSLCFVVMTALSVATAVAQESPGSRTDPPRAARPQTPDEFHAAFWNHIVKKDDAYNTWTVLAHEQLSDELKSPHSTFSKTYANKVAAGDTKSLTFGSILVREDYDAERKRQSISVLYRVKDYDKEHSNWYYLRFTEAGAVMKGKDGKPLAGKVGSCIECHAKASGKDFVFANDSLKK